MDPFTYAAIAAATMALQSQQAAKARKSKAMADSAEGKNAMAQNRFSLQQEQGQTALGDLISAYRGTMGVRG